MKKIFSLFLTIIFIFTLSLHNNVQANEVHIPLETTVSVIYLDNGDYIETSIVTIPSLNNEASILATNTKTGTKTSTYKNSSGEALWSVSVTGTFTYTGQSSTCTSVSGTSKSYSSAWKVSATTNSKSGNTATAKATGTHYILGVAVNTYALSVTLTCSSTGVLS